MSRLTTVGLALVAMLVCVAVYASAPRDTIHLTDGDRISGKILTRGLRRIRIQTAYGLLVIPKEDVARIVGADGREEILAEPARVSFDVAPPPSPAPALKVSVVVRGASFWQAWDEKAAPADPTLRLVLRLDETEVVAWSDATLDEGEIKGAIVNTFSFEPGALVAEALAEGVIATPPATNPGRVVLRVTLPVSWEGRHRVGVAYQRTEETAGGRAWRDLAWTVGSIELQPDQMSVLTVDQDRGSMAYSGFPRRRMKGAESFRLEISNEE